MSLLTVEYDWEKQVEEMMTALGATFMRFQETKAFEGEVITDCSLISAWSLGFKNPAFHSEREVRCLHVADVVPGEHGVRLQSIVGESEEKEVPGPLISYEVRDGCVTPYMDMHLASDGKPLPVKEIVMGPKSPNAPGNIFFFLGSLGLGDVSIRASSASYR